MTKIRKPRKMRFREGWCSAVFWPFALKFVQKSKVGQKSLRLNLQVGKRLPGGVLAALKTRFSGFQGWVHKFRPNPTFPFSPLICLSNDLKPIKLEKSANFGLDGALSEAPRWFRFFRPENSLSEPFSQIFLPAILTPTYP